MSDARHTPDDGTDTTGFFNTEYFVDLKPKDEWRPVFKQNKEELIAAMDRELEKTPGVIWNFSQPISDNVEEAVSGVKGELAVKLYGTDLKTLEEKGDEIVSVMSGIRGVATECLLSDRGSADPDGPTRAALGMRAAAVEHPTGAVVVVGCAPTALDEVLDLAGRGVFAPALVVGMPVGFVGAAAAKAPPNSASARTLAAMYCSQCAREARIVVLGPSMVELECRHCERG